MDIKENNKIIAIIEGKIEELRKKKEELLNINLLPIIEMNKKHVGKYFKQEDYLMKIIKVDELGNLITLYTNLLVDILDDDKEYFKSIEEVKKDGYEEITKEKFYEILIKKAREEIEEIFEN